MKRQILPPNPFSVADSVRAAQARSGIRAVFPTEQDSLQEKGARKDLVILVESRLALSLLQDVVQNSFQLVD